MKSTLTLQRPREPAATTDGSDLEKLRAATAAAAATLTKARETADAARLAARGSAAAAVLSGGASAYHEAQAALTVAAQAQAEAENFHGGLSDALKAAESEAKAADLARRWHEAERRGGDLNAKAKEVDVLARSLAAALLDFNDCNRDFWASLPSRPSSAGPIPTASINALVLNRLAGATANRFGRISGLVTIAELQAHPGLPGETEKHVTWLLAEQNKTTTPPKEAA